MAEKISHTPLIKAGIVLGTGLGGFLDGIVLHQILQLHNMLSARMEKSSIANLEVNMFWDGVFHAATWLATVIGLTLLWRVGRRTDVPWNARTFVGSLFVGWGLFNLVEGIIDHHILHLHHVVESAGESVYDLVFLGISILFVLGGMMAIKSGRRHEVVIRLLHGRAPGHA